MSRELYDLCRRYKHYWKKVEDVKALNDKYHDLDLSDALSHSTGQLFETEDEMLKQLFMDFKVICMGVDTENEVFERPMWHTSSMFPYRFEPNPKLCSSTSTLDIKDSRRFIRCLCEYMNDIRRMR